MTTVVYESNGNMFTLTCKGHADYAPKGQDIVCAGISTLCGALENALDNLQNAGYAQSWSCSAADAFFQAQAVTTGENLLVETVFETVYGGLCRIEETYAPYLQCRRKMRRKEEKQCK